MANYWFTSPEGIRAHYSDEREAAVADHQRRMKRIDDDENNMLDALANRELAQK